MSRELEILGAYLYTPPMNGDAAEVTLDGEYTKYQLIKLVEYMEREEKKKKMNQKELRVGQKVTFAPSYMRKEDYEHGMIKEIPAHTDDSVRVVYSCNDDWDNYMSYTSELTNLRDLKEGWV